MKRKLLVLSTLAITPILGFSTVISCKQPNKGKEEIISKQKGKDEYYQTRNNYEKQLTDFSDQLKAIYDKINSSKDNEEKKTLKQQRITFLKEKSTILKDLQKNLEEKFTNLQKLEKEDNLKTIRILHTNDEHGRILFDSGKYNLYSGVQTLNKYFKNTKFDLLLSAGDLIQGLPLSDSDKGATILELARDAGYDAIAIGNHEFDYGLDHVLKLNEKLKKEGNLKYLSSNIVYKANEKTKPFDAYTIKKMNNDLNIAIIGLTTPDTAITSNPKNSESVLFKKPVESTKETIKEIKEKNETIDMFIALSHLGVGRSDRELTSEFLGENVSDISLIIDGHSHSKIPVKKIDNSNTYLTQTEAYTKYLGDIVLEFDKTKKEITKIDQKLRDIYQIELLTFDYAQEIINNLKNEFSVENEKIIFDSTIDFIHLESVELDGVSYWKGRVKPTNLGVFASNAIAWELVEAKKDEKLDENNTIGLMNGGGLRSNVSKGKVSKGDLLAVSPFGNLTTAVKIKGKDLLEVFKHGASKAKSGAFAQYSDNVAYTINTKKVAKDGKEETVFEIDVNSIKINGNAIESEKDYYVATNDFLVVGGDGYNTLKEKATVIYENKKLIDSFEDYIKFITDDKSDLNARKFAKKLADYDGDKIIEKMVVNLPEKK